VNILLLKSFDSRGEEDPSLWFGLSQALAEFNFFLRILRYFDMDMALGAKITLLQSFVSSWLTLQGVLMRPSPFVFELK
jgi:hypothetical protein